VATIYELPSIIRAGTQIELIRSSTDYPATSYDGFLRFIPSDGAVTSPMLITGTASGIDHKFVIDTSLWTAGQYSACFYVTDSEDTVLFIDEGFVTVRPNPATATGTTNLTFAAKMVKTIKTAIETLSAGGLLTTSVSVGGKSYTRSNMSELRQELAHWQALLQAEQGGTTSNQAGWTTHKVYL
jgi:hypothetical protein